jgi:hypothetical protein
MSEESKPDLWRYALLVLVVLLVIANGVQYWRYQSLEADHCALQINAKAWVETIKNLGEASKRRQAKQDRQPDDATRGAGAD